MKFYYHANVKEEEGEEEEGEVAKSPRRRQEMQRQAPHP